MALALQDANYVWQKVAKALDVQTAGTAGTAANPASSDVFRALKKQMATNMLSPQLQFVPLYTYVIDAHPDADSAQFCAAQFWKRLAARDPAAA